jgi:hypothetical protein
MVMFGDKIENVERKTQSWLDSVDTVKSMRIKKM